MAAMTCHPFAFLISWKMVNILFSLYGFLLSCFRCTISISNWRSTRLSISTASGNVLSSTGCYNWKLASWIAPPSSFVFHICFNRSNRWEGLWSCCYLLWGVRPKQTEKRTADQVGPQLTREGTSVCSPEPIHLHSFTLAFLWHI